MVISNNARERIIELIKNDITETRVGDNGTDPKRSDTALKSDLGISKSPELQQSENRLSITTTIFSTELIGETLREQGVFFNGILLDRVVFPDFEKNDENEFIITNVIRAT